MNAVIGSGTYVLNRFMAGWELTMELIRRYFHRTKEMYSLMLAGQRMYILQSVPDITAALRNNSTLTTHEHILDMMTRFGTTVSGLEAMQKPPSPSMLDSPTLQPNRLHRPLAVLCEAFMKKQLNPGRYLDGIQSSYLSILHQRLCWERMSPKAVLASTDTRRTISLLEWTRRSLVEAGTVAIFGSSLLKIDPLFVNHFFEFEDMIWKLLYRIPRPWSNDMLAAKDRMHRAMIAYLSQPKEQRADCCWLVSTLETEMKIRNITDHDIARNLMLVHWLYVYLQLTL